MRPLTSSTSSVPADRASCQWLNTFILPLFRLILLCIGYLGVRKWAVGIDLGQFEGTFFHISFFIGAIEHSHLFLSPTGKPYSLTAAKNLYLFACLFIYLMKSICYVVILWCIYSSINCSVWLLNYWTLSNVRIRHSCVFIYLFVCLFICPFLRVITCPRFRVFSKLIWSLILFFPRSTSKANNWYIRSD